jgi:hypothetical protein
MIEVRCAACEEGFPVPDESAGLTEQCPHCGALNDIPDDTQVAEDIEAPVDMSLPGEVPLKGGMPGWLWWSLLIVTVGLFSAAIYWLNSDDWEQKHLDELAAKWNQAEELAVSGDFDQALKGYNGIVAEVGNRRLQSKYLQDMMQTVQQRLAAMGRDALIAARVKSAEEKIAAKQWQDAVDDFLAAISLTPKDLPSSDPISPVLARAGRELGAARDGLAAQSKGIASILDPTTFPTPAIEASTQPEGDTVILQAIKQFQRSGEGFASLVASHPIVFVDANGKYRQRQYVIWGIASRNSETGDEPGTSMQLEYQETSRMTSPHDDRAAAASDGNFILDEVDRTIYHRTRFRLAGGKWVADGRQRGDGQTWLDAKAAQFAEKAGGFDRQDLWQLEDQAFSGAR